MDKQRLMIQIRIKKLGLLLADARLSVHRSPEDCALIMGVELEEYLDYEKGVRSPSLPQIETLACYLNIPLDHFRGKIPRELEESWEFENIQNRNQIRNHFICAQLRLGREAAGISLENIEEQTSIGIETLRQFESGEKPVSLAELEMLLPIVDMDIQSLYDRLGPVGLWHLQQEAKVFQNLPQEIQDFISKPINQPYLELAIRLSNMPVEKLRAIAETLLEIAL